MSWVSQLMGFDAKGEAAAQGRAAQEYATEQGLGALRDTVEQGNQLLFQGGVKSRGELESALTSGNMALRNQYGDAQGVMSDALKMQRGDFNPYQRAGASALSKLAGGNLVGDISQNPAFKFKMEQGQKAIDSNQAAKGMLNSGARLKALQKFGQGLASEEYGKEYDRQANRLAGIAGLGMQGAQGAAGAAGQYGANSANAYMGLGNQMSQNYMGTGQNMANSYQNQYGTQAQNLIGLGQGSANLMTGLGNAQAASYAAGAANPLDALNAISGATAAGAKAYTAFSDERLKTDVEPIKKSELAEMKKHLKAVFFNYRSDAHGSGRWAGVMAQDLEKSKLGRTLVSENSLGEKMVDMKKVLSMFLATMAMEG